MAELKLYNTLTRKKEPFVPLDAANLRMYVCGPTVYDFAHIGNARPVIVFDVLFRLLRHLYGVEHVTYARNITDVDDKINDRAARDFPGLALNEAIRRVTEGTNAQFQADVKALGCLEPTYQPRATEHLDEMRAIIERLVDKGFAYVAEDHVLFSPEAMNKANGRLPAYGSLANRSLDEMIAGARVDVAPYKRGATDFVLWKPSDPGQPGWPSPCGIATTGRPGWHIECSAMSMARLLSPFGGGLSCDDPAKNTFDIHGGGIDLVFPHHENEIAQSCCAFGTPRMANIWMHNGFLQVEGQKMSKSLGNFTTIADVLKDWPGEVARLTMLKTHYRQPIDWRLSSLIESQAELEKFAKAADINAFQASGILAERADFPREPQCDHRVIEALCDDLNTPAAIMALRSIYKESPEGEFGENLNLLKACEWLGILSPRNLTQHTYDIFGQAFIFNESAIENVRKFRVSRANGMIERSNDYRDNLSYLGYTVYCDPVGSYIEIKPSEPEWNGVIERMISLRLAARNAKNWAESDRIRDELASKGIQLKDGKDEAGNPVTTWEVKR